MTPTNLETSFMFVDQTGNVASGAPPALPSPRVGRPIPELALSRLPETRPGEGLPTHRDHSLDRVPSPFFTRKVVAGCVGAGLVLSLTTALIWQHCHSKTRQ
jgi:hypothetical protein